MSGNFRKIVQRRITEDRYTTVRIWKPRSVKGNIDGLLYKDILCRYSWEDAVSQYKECSTQLDDRGCFRTKVQYFLFYSLRSYRFWAHQATYSVAYVSQGIKRLGREDDNCLSSALRPPKEVPSTSRSRCFALSSRVFLSVRLATPFTQMLIVISNK
jgi:hypothetical protein